MRPPYHFLKRLSTLQIQESLGLADPFDVTLLKRKMIRIALTATYRPVSVFSNSPRTFTEHVNGNANH